MNTSWEHSDAHNRFIFNKGWGCYERLIERINANYPGVEVIRPSSAKDWYHMCKEFTQLQSQKEHKNDRSRCFSEVLVVVANFGVMFRRRASRWIVRSVGALVGIRYGHLDTRIEREIASLLFSREWLSAIFKVRLADIDIIEGCKADITVNM
jgi:hypothetical protein